MLKKENSNKKVEESKLDIRNNEYELIKLIVELYF